jgi:hypothetical protein
LLHASVQFPTPCPPRRFEKVEKMRAEIRRKELLEKKLKGEVEEEELEGQLDREEAKIDETEEAGARSLAAGSDAAPPPRHASCACATLLRNAPPLLPAC